MTRFQFFLVSVLCASIPLTAQAKLDLYNPNKKYKDEGAVPTNAASRCVSSEFQKAHAAALANAKKEYEGMKAQGKVESAILDRAYAKYQQDLATGWSAMQEPYCGFGAFGVTAALKSFRKTIADAQKQFRENVKAKNPENIAVIAVPASSVSTSTENGERDVEPVRVEEKQLVPAQKTGDHAAIQLTRLLKRGMKHAEVKRMQEMLIQKGYLPADLATGFFGSATEAAIKKFQLKKKLIQSDESPGAGWVGPKTRAALVDE